MPTSTASGKSSSNVQNWPAAPHSNAGGKILSRIFKFLTASPPKGSVSVIRGYGPNGYGVNPFQKMKGGGTAPKPGPAPFTPATYVSPTTIQFNLPPHAWSLPINPATTNTSIYNGNTVDNSTRRAIMWYYDDAQGVSNNGILTPSNSPSSQTSEKTTGTTKSTEAITNWGFQFLWNPQQFTSVLTRNSNVIPSALDSHAALSGLFTAMEAIQLTIVIDRVNDFACFKSLNTPGGYTQFYTAGGTAGVKQNTPALINDLMKKGTMADIEFIYKMINGSGRVDESGKNLVWVNALNRETADLAFLAPTAIALQLGPNTDSLSYVGWIESLSINHTMFTEDMIPIHSEIAISFNAFSRVSLLSKG
jgi:hypothetical protein